MNILHDFITAAERVGSKAEPVPRRMRSCQYGKWIYEPASQIATCTTGRAIDGVPLDLAATIAKDAMGEYWVGHDVHAPVKRPPTSPLARAIAKRHFEAPQR